MDINMNKNTAIKKDDIKNLHNIGSVGPKSPQNHSSQSMMHLRDLRKDIAALMELNDKITRLIKENASKLQKRARQLHERITCDRLVKIRKSMRDAIAVHRHRSMLKKALASRELPVDKKCLQSVACKDVFDMSSLSESLPPKSSNYDMENKIKRLRKEYLLYVKQRRQVSKRAKILLCASNSNELNKNLPSSSAKIDKSLISSSIVEKICDYQKPDHILSIKPLLESQSSSTSDKSCISLSCPEFEDLPISHKEETLNLERKIRPEIMRLQIEETTNKLQPLVFKNGVLLGKKHKNYKKKLRLISKIEKTSQNSELFPSFKNQCSDVKHNTMPQKFQNTNSLCRQLRRLTIQNSKKGGE